MSQKNSHTHRHSSLRKLTRRGQAPFFCCSASIAVLEPSLAVAQDKSLIYWVSVFFTIFSLVSKPEHSFPMSVYFYRNCLCEVQAQNCRNYRALKVSLEEITRLCFNHESIYQRQTQESCSRLLKAMLAFTTKDQDMASKFIRYPCLRWRG